MKNLFLILVCIFLQLNIFAQRDETLFGKSGLRLTGIWGGPVMNFSYFDNDFSAVSGGYFGLEFNKNVFLGYGKYKMVNADNFDIEGIVTPDFRLSYHGGLIGFSPLAHKIIHPQMMVLIGSGRVEQDGSRADNVFVLQPSGGVEVNVFRWARIGLEGGYRFITDSELEDLNNDRLSGFFGEVKFKFGLSWGKKRRKGDKSRTFEFKEEL